MLLNDGELEPLCTRISIKAKGIKDFLNDKVEKIKNILKPPHPKGLGILL